MKFNSDIDIDLADRNLLLEHISVIPAAIRSGGTVKKHNTGVHPTSIPFDPMHGVSALDYNVAEERGYVKLDLLNVWVYKLVRSEEHLVELMREPDWSNLRKREFFEKLIHIGKHYQTMCELPQPIDSIPRLAMFLALIRPGKRHLLGKDWSHISEHIWQPDSNGLYTFKKSHAIAYAHLVVVNMNLLADDPTASALQE